MRTKKKEKRRWVGTMKRAFSPTKKTDETDKKTEDQWTGLLYVIFDGDN